MPDQDEPGDESVDVFVQKLFYQRAFDITAGALERTRSGAQAISVAAATIASVYSGLLAVAASSGRQVPICALLPGLALGGCLVYSSNFLVQLGRGAGSGEVAEADRQADSAEDEPAEAEITANDATLDRFIESMSGRIQGGAHLLRGSILMLGLSVALMPSPFIVMSSGHFREVNEAWPKAPKGTLSPQSLYLYRSRLEGVSSSREWVSNSTVDYIVASILVVFLVAAIAWVHYSRTDERGAT